MTYGFVLLEYWLVTLRISLANVCLATEVEQILCLVKIALLTSKGIETGKSHLGYLMTWYYSSLPRCRTNLTAHAVGITTGYVEKLMAACSLNMSARYSLHPR